MLADVVASYLRHVHELINHRLGRSDGDHALSQVHPFPLAVRSWFEECETTDGWRALVDACAEAFQEEGHRRRARWESALRHWFRRAGIYQNVLDGTRPDERGTAEALAVAARAREERVVRFAVLDGVYFAKDLMDFGDFQIVRPSSAELGTLLGIPANRLFYPHAVASTDRLPNHWYIRYGMTESRPSLGSIILTEGMFSGPVRPTYSEFDCLLEDALKVLVLSGQLGLREEYHPNGWLGVSIPFVIDVRDNPLEAPPSAPPIDKLLYEPCVDNNGEEEGERPTIFIHLNKAEAAKFEAFIHAARGQLNSIRTANEEWQQFIDRGLGYLVKAYFANGIDQLIWHIVALEALVGEERRIREGIATRLAALYDKDPERSKAASKEFRELYDMRCSYVHGRPFKKQTDSNHLWRAREIAVAIANRLLELMSSIIPAAPGGVRALPKREDLLEVLYAEGIRAQHADLARLLSS